MSLTLKGTMFEVRVTETDESHLYMCELSFFLIIIIKTNEEF